ncbi:MAG: DAK2 domain-containing protein [Lachnospiraceae bacterium]|nr:DAK2 domain-containing protein [Lachnospiraceae bacterium]
MGVNKLDAQLLAKMFLAAAKNLEASKEWINDLNVFPVPDGDTGTNMTMTIMSAAGDVSTLEDVNMEALCKCISSGSLRGARGNSGVILSQLLRGFTKVVKHHEEIDAAVIADAFDKAVETAYKAVMKPKEGTILTVAKGAAMKAGELLDEGVTDLEPFFAEVIRYAEEVLAKTPDMLPVLKEAGVVDSGGQGLIQVLKGAYDAYLGKELDLTIPEGASKGTATRMRAKAYDSDTETDIKFGYCTEFIILLERPLNQKQETDFRSFLNSIGDSIVMVADDDLVKIHVHTNDPGLAIQRALTLGALSNMKIDNMRMEHREKLFHKNADGSWSENLQAVSGAAEQLYEEDVQAADSVKAQSKMPHKDMGFVAVCAGKGMAEIFKGLGVDYVIEGGQTMNPSTADILDAVSAVNADTVFVLPNNKNIILAAEQAEKMSENQTIIVIPSKTIPQGITAAINYADGMSVEENTEAMRLALDAVQSGEVTYAVRDTSIEGTEIHKGDFMAIGDNGLMATGTDVTDVTFAMVEKMMEAEAELISLYYGEDVTEEAALALQEKIASAYPDADVELQQGGQPIYYYIVSAE